MTTTPRSRLVEAGKQVRIAREDLDGHPVAPDVADIQADIDTVLASCAESHGDDGSGEESSRIPATGGLRRR